MREGGNEITAISSVTYVSHVDLDTNACHVTDTDAYPSMNQYSRKANNLRATEVSSVLL